MSPHFEASFRASCNAILLLLAAGTLAFLAWNTILHGAAVKGDPEFQSRAARLFLLLGCTLAFSLLPEAGRLWQEGLRRRELPPAGDASCVRKRSFRAVGSALPLIRHCAGEMEGHFRRYYAFHRYEAPYVAYFFHAKKGSLSLLGLPWMKTGFLLLFLVGATFVGRGGSPGLLGWERTLLGAGGMFVVAGLLIGLAIPYRKFWLRIVEENNRICVTCTSVGRPRDRWFEAFLRSVEAQAGVVSCPSQSR